MVNPGPNPSTEASLQRRIGLPLLVLYGLGTILGAGIYVLIGVVAASAGALTPFAFLLAAVVAVPTAFSYAELAARFPRAAGEAIYVAEAFRLPQLTTLVGVMVIMIGVISSATMARGFIGYLGLFFILPDEVVVIGLVLMLMAIAAYGVLESVAFASLITLVEIGGLFLVIGAGLDNLGTLQWSSLVSSTSSPLLTAAGVVAGAFFAFYAFIGFEDIVNVAEETRNPERNLPRAILLSLGVASTLYFVVAIVAIAAVPLETLANHPAPLAVVVELDGTIPVEVIGTISVLAVVNGALVQVIKTSRVVYGMARMGHAPAVFGTVNRFTRTPLVATVAVASSILVLALAFNLETLAGMTSTATLIVFAVVNAALIRQRANGPASSTIAFAWWVPWVGLATCISLLVASMLL